MTIVSYIVVFIPICTLIILLEHVIIINIVNIWFSITMQMENNRKTTEPAGDNITAYT